MSYIPKRRWLISYPEDQFDFHKVLDIIPAVEESINSKGYLPELIYLNIEPGCLPSHYIHNQTININTEINGGIGELKTDDKSTGIDRFRFSFTEKAKYSKVRLLYPYLGSDKRWESIDITTASLFLGSSLVNNGFKVETLKAEFEDFKKLQFDSDEILGLTLFEDLLPETRELVKRVKESSGSIIAAGGPAVTLNPMETAYYLKDINIFIRGEADYNLSLLLKALNRGDIEKILELKGVILNFPGFTLISDMDSQNVIEDFSKIRFNLSFLEPEQLKQGLEINITRGCQRSCLFCSKVQGKVIRKLPLTLFSDLLDEATKLGSGKFININDDDILQDLDFCQEVFKIIGHKGYKIWGIQTSLNSFFNKKGTLDPEVLEAISDPSLYVDGTPLLWLGTDVFLTDRGRRIGKKIPPKGRIKELVEVFQHKGIRNYHYWISSDHQSSWEEFVEEFSFITELAMEFPHFNLLPHAPFTVPYVSTPIHNLVNENKEWKTQIRYREFLNRDSNKYQFPIAQKLVTNFESLNSLLNNNFSVEKRGFFCYLKEKDYPKCFMTLYNFLKDERMKLSSFQPGQSEKLKDLEKKVEFTLSKLLF